MANSLREYLQQYAQQTKYHSNRTVTKKATTGEKVLGALFPNRSYGWPGGWSADRLEQVLHLKNWTYVAISAIAKKIGQLIPNMAYVRAQRIPGRTHKFTKALSVVKPHEELEPLDFEHPCRRLIENPNPVDTSFDLLYELDMFMELCGVAYLWAVPNSFGTPCELWVLPSHWVWPRTGGLKYVDPNNPHADELINYYEIRPWGGMGSAGMLKFPPNEVIMFPWKSPVNKIDGYSPLSAAAQWIDSEESISRSRWAQFQNQARPEFWVEVGEGYEDMDDARIQRLESKIANRYQGELNYGKPLITPPGTKIQPLSFNPTEMAYFQCLDEQTECLTEDGWKKYTELTKETKVACYDKVSNKLVYHKPSRVLVSDYSGVMHHWQSDEADLLVTPGHRMYVQRMNRAGYPLKPEDGIWEVAKISDLNPSQHYRVLTSAPVVNNEPDDVVIPMYKKYAKGEPNIVGTYKIPAGDWARFLGWYVSEGNLSKPDDKGYEGGRRRRHRIVGASQKIDSKYTQTIEKAIEKVPPYKWSKNVCGGKGNRGCYQWYSTDRGLYLHLKEHCGATARYKKLPRYVMSWPAHTLKILLEAAISGDGKVYDENKFGWNSKHYRTTSKQLADDIAEVAIKCGLRATMNTCNGAYTVHLSDHNFVNIHHEHQSTEQYDGKIWCLTVPTTFFVVRRNGKVHVTGNSEEQIRDMVLSVFGVPKAVVGVTNDMTYGSILATMASFCTFCINPRLVMLGLRATKFLAPKFRHVDSAPIRIWWDDCSPPDPSQVNSDIQIDAQQGAITPNEIRAMRGRKPYQHGGDDPLMPGPGGTVPLPLNTGDNLTDLAKLVPTLGQPPMQPPPGESGPPPEMAGDNGPTSPEQGSPMPHQQAGQVPPKKVDDEHTDGLLNERPVYDPGIKDPNGKPVVGGVKGLHRAVTKKAGTFKFSSTQLDVPADLGAAIVAKSKELIAVEDLADDGFETDPHITIKYGLHPGYLQDVIELVSGYGPVKVELGKISVFYSKDTSTQRGGANKYDVVKVQVMGDSLIKLNKLLSRNLPHTDTYPTYNPHLTLAYVKPGTGVKYDGDNSLQGIKLTFDTITYCRKSGDKTKISLIKGVTTMKMHKLVSLTKKLVNSLKLKSEHRIVTKGVSNGSSVARKVEFAAVRVNCAKSLKTFVTELVDFYNLVKGLGIHSRRELEVLKSATSHVKAGYFAECDRDDKGHCKPSGGGGGGSGGGGKPKPSGGEGGSGGGKGGKTKIPKQHAQVHQQAQKVTTQLGKNLKNKLGKATAGLPPKQKAAVKQAVKEAMDESREASRGVLEKFNLESRYGITGAAAIKAAAIPFAITAAAASVPLTLLGAATGDSGRIFDGAGHLGGAVGTALAMGVAEAVRGGYKAGQWLSGSGKAAGDDITKDVKEGEEDSKPSKEAEARGAKLTPEQLKKLGKKLMSKIAAELKHRMEGKGDEYDKLNKVVEQAQNNKSV